MIKEQINRSALKSNAMPLQEAAEKLCNTPFGITNAQVDALRSFLNKIDELKPGIHNKELPSLLLDIWRKSGLEEYHRNKNQNKKFPKKKGGASVTAKEGKTTKPCCIQLDIEAKEKDNVPRVPKIGEIGVKETNIAPKIPKRPYRPEGIVALLDLARQHVEVWKKREELITLDKSNQESNTGKKSINASLVDLSRKVAVEYIHQLTWIVFRNISSMISS